MQERRTHHRRPPILTGDTSISSRTPVSQPSWPVTSASSNLQAPSAARFPPPRRQDGARDGVQLGARPRDGARRLAYSAAPATRHEVHVQIDHLGTALLSLLLLEPLRRAAAAMGPARLTIVASFGAAGGRRGAPFIVGRPRERAGVARRPGLLRQGDHARALRALEAARRAPGPRARGPRRPHARRRRRRRRQPRLLPQRVPLRRLGAEGLSRHFAWPAEQRAWCMAEAAVGHAGEAWRGGGLPCHPFCASRVGRRDADITVADSRLCSRVSKVVLSCEGEEAQKKLWKETLELLRREAEGTDLSEFEYS
ncbi:hypothetical protein DL770_004674 [Monosporascus sp. CRB-9-2]|nr:hypothetical protein DL770_004674 [Monosporascus sp. CRB-9-2]